MIARKIFCVNIFLFYNLMRAVVVELVCMKWNSPLEKVVSNSDSNEAPDNGDKLFEEGDSFYAGDDDHIQDYKEAYRLYQRAAELGSLPAYVRLGDLCKAGEGARKDKQKALEYFKSGVRKGNFICYHKMAELFIEEWASSGFTNVEAKSNAFKCWDKFFQQASQKSGNWFTDEVNVDLCMAVYIRYCMICSLEIKKYKLISERKNGILKYLDYAISLSYPDGSQGEATWKPALEWVKNNL